MKEHRNGISVSQLCSIVDEKDLADYIQTNETNFKILLCRDDIIVVQLFYIF